MLFDFKKLVAQIVKKILRVVFIPSGIELECQKCNPNTWLDLRGETSSAGIKNFYSKI